MAANDRTIWVLGAGGHARSVVAALRSHGDLNCECVVEVEEARVPHRSFLAVGVGNLYARLRVFRRYNRLYFVNIIHRTAYVEHDVERGYGFQVMAHGYVGIGTVVRDNVLINTGAQVDHDCLIEDHCIISPGAVLCGGVELGEECFIGAGAVVLEGVKLARRSFIPADALVVGPDDIRPRHRDAVGLRAAEVGGDPPADGVG